MINKILVGLILSPLFLQSDKKPKEAVNPYTTYYTGDTKNPYTTTFDTKNIVSSYDDTVSFYGPIEDDSKIPWQVYTLKTKKGIWHCAATSYGWKAFQITCMDLRN